MQNQNYFYSMQWAKYVRQILSKLHFTFHDKYYCLNYCKLGKFRDINCLVKVTALYLGKAKIKLWTVFKILNMMKTRNKLRNKAFLQNSPVYAHFLHGRSKFVELSRLGILFTSLCLGQPIKFWFSNSLF